MNTVAKIDENPTWAQVISRVSPRFNEIASRDQMVTWAEESQFALQAIQKNAKLAGCVITTVQNAIINVAAVGLTLNPVLGYAYLVPEAVKQADGKYLDECMLRISFKGLVKAATDCGSIKWAKAEVVKENDTFVYNGPCEMPRHSMDPFGARGKTVGVYCIAKTLDGDYLSDIMSADEVMKVRASAKTKSVWDAWPDEMAKKAMIKRASKQWPKTDRSDRLAKVVALVNEHEGSEPIEHEPRAGKWLAAPDSVTEDQVKRLRGALEMADISEAAFCAHKSITIDRLESLPAQRFAGAMKYLQGKAQGENQ